jgi:hypothetical protein
VDAECRYVGTDRGDAPSAFPQRAGGRQSGTAFPPAAGQRDRDPIAGISVERALAGGRWVTSVVGRLPFAENKDGLRVGVSSEASTGWARTVGSHRVMAYGRFDWFHREQDTFNGTPVLVGGGNWVYLTPGVAVMVGKGINVQLDVKVPVYRNLANRQLDSPAIFQFGLSRPF